MMEKKNIDRLFQEKFKDFEVVPDEKVWANIEAELAKKKKRRVVPFWFRLAGAAAILILSGLLLYKLVFSGNGLEGKIVEEEKIEIQDSLPGTSGNPVDNRSDKQRQNSAIGETSYESVAEQSKDESEIEKVDNNPIENPSATYKNSPKKPQNVQRHKSPNAGSRTAIADSEKNRAKNQLPKATNRDVLHLEDNAGDRNGNQAVAQSPNNDKNTFKNGIRVTKNSSDGNQPKSGQNNINGQDLDRSLNPKVGESQLADESNREMPKQDNNGKQSFDLKPSENTSVADTDTKKDSTGIATVVPNALEELLNEKENKVTATEQKVNRWQITSNVAPIYFSSTSNGSPLDPRFEENRKTYAPSISYGVGAKYAISKKFFIKSGIHSVALEYNTSDVIFFQTENARKIKNVTPNIQGSLIQVDNIPDAAVSTFGRAIRQFEGDLNQRITYVEIPMELSYQVLQRKIGVELIGGFSTMILNENEVSLVSSGMDMNIGRADNLNSVHFSTNIGVGLKYNFLRKFEANVEPMFKYQINTFSDDAGNFKPYFFGLYTGLSYRF